MARKDNTSADQKPKPKPKPETKSSLPINPRDMTPGREGKMQTR